MVETGLNITGGFDIAVLTHKRRVGALGAKAPCFSESAKNKRLFLISSNAVIEELPVKHSEIKCAPKKQTINRKQVTFDDTFTYGENVYRINNGNDGKLLGLYVEILRRIIEQFEIAMLKWKRVLVLRFDLHISFDTKDNKQMTAFRKRLVQRLKREYGFKDIGYCWVREYHGKGKGQHYHWVLFLDGNLIRHSKRINEIIKQTWERPTGGYHVPIIKHPFYFADRNEIVQDAIYRVSYLAKTRGKGYRDNQTKDYQCSRMKELL